MDRLDHPLYQARLRQLCGAGLAQPLSGKTFFLAGATGMIGTFLVDALMLLNRSGAQIRIYAVGRDAARAARRFPRYLDSPLFTFLAHDVNAPFQDAVRADYYIHAASNTHPLSYAADPVGTITANIAGTRNVLDAAAAAPSSRTLFCSSVEVYGENRGDTKAFDESYMGYLDCNTLRAGYPESKRAGESLCQAYREAYGADILTIRLSRVYGPTMLPSDSKALSQFIAHAARGEPVPLKSAGTQLYSYMHVCDAAGAMLHVLLHGKSGEAYNAAGPGRPLPLREIARIAAQSAGVPVVDAAPSKREAAGYSKAATAVLDTGKLQSLGFQGRVELAQGVRETVRLVAQLWGTP